MTCPSLSYKETEPKIVRPPPSCPAAMPAQRNGPADQRRCRLSPQGATPIVAGGAAAAAARGAGGLVPSSTFYAYKVTTILETVIRCPIALVELGFKQCVNSLNDAWQGLNA